MRLLLATPYDPPLVDVCCFSIGDGVARAKPDNTGRGSATLTRDELEQAPERGT